MNIKIIDAVVKDFFTTESLRVHGGMMKAKCDSCPFASKGFGLKLRKSLMPGRWREIIQGVLMGQPFYCHKTTDEDAQDEDSDYYRPTGKEQVCFGSLEYLRKLK